MINHDGKHLLIFTNFHIDFNLLKWKDRSSNEPEQYIDIETPQSSPGFNLPTGFVIAASSGTVSGTATSISIFERLFGNSRKRRKIEEERIANEMNSSNFSIKDSEATIIPEKISPKEFFDSIKDSAEALQLANERFANYEKAIAHLKRSGQLALLQRMQADLEIHINETKLYSIGYKKVITEANVIKFAKDAPRTIRIDWIKNFTRLIPESILSAKEECDKHKIFDNYVIMHYDPYNDGTLETLEEVKARELKEKDPIIFGLIMGSNKLYYIGDWLDEYCDLTFDKLVEIVGEHAISANDLNVDIKISNE